MRAWPYTRKRLNTHTENVLELLHRLAAGLDLADQGKGDLAVGPDEDDLVQVLVVPDLDLEDIRRADHVGLVGALSRDHGEQREEHGNNERERQPAETAH